jgi:signal peptide peptidase SppA
VERIADIRRAVASAAPDVWALATARASGIVNLLADISRGGAALADDAKLAAAFGLDAAPPTSSSAATMRAIMQAAIRQAAAGGRTFRSEKGAVGVLEFRGMALYGLPGLQPYIADPKELAREVTALAGDPAISRIAIVFDSPGGAVTGVSETADAVAAAARVKPVFVIVDTLCASAAYWIGSQCTELIALGSGDVGSVGVWTMHIDQSKALENAGLKVSLIHSGEKKIAANSFEPLAAEDRAWIQQQTDVIYSEFVRAVARGRKVSAGTVREKFGKGRLLRAGDAAKLGMVDRLETADDAFSLVVNGRRTKATINAELAALRAEVAR